MMLPERRIIVRRKGFCLVLLWGVAEFVTVPIPERHTAALSKALYALRRTGELILVLKYIYSIFEEKYSKYYQSLYAGYILAAS
eukprot:6193678-Pleurochrysis_carterae.AAC.1